MIEIIQLTPDFAIGRQPDDADFASIKDAGFRSILNARPDTENGDYILSDQARNLAADVGLKYGFSPTENHAVLEPVSVDAFERFLIELPEPIFAHCKSGTRAAILWALVAARHRSVEAVIATLRAAGQELEFLEDEMRESAVHAERSPLRLKDDGLLALGRSPLLGK